jgi:hypothetical protein
MWWANGIGVSTSLSIRTPNSDRSYTQSTAHGIEVDLRNEINTVLDIHAPE